MIWYIAKILLIGGTICAIFGLVIALLIAFVNSQPLDDGNSTSDDMVHRSQPDRFDNHTWFLHRSKIHRKK